VNFTLNLPLPLPLPLPYSLAHNTTSPIFKGGNNNEITVISCKNFHERACKLCVWTYRLQKTRRRLRAPLSLCSACPMHCHGGVGSDNIMSRCVHLFTPAPVGMIYSGWQAVYIKRFTFDPPREPLKTSCDLNAATGVTAITVAVMSSIIINDRSNIRAA